MDLSNEVKAAVAAKVAESILASLEGPERDAILQKAVAEFLGGYDLKRLITEAMHGRAVQLAARVIEAGAYDEQIETAIRSGLDAVLTRLPNASRLAFVEMLAGKSGTSGYDRAGAILSHLREPDRA